ncbi:MAG: hypothetical protein OD814_001668 [Candidatus Alkanophagales archaeon MCA70_species_1]|nr:hypothetical protein [Candidatus Alkanophaga volatiphilum]
MLRYGGLALMIYGLYGLMKWAAPLWTLSERTMPQGALWLLIIGIISFILGFCIEEK